MNRDPGACYGSGRDEVASRIDLKKIVIHDLVHMAYMMDAEDAAGEKWPWYI